MKLSLNSLSRVALAVLALSLTVSCLPTGTGPYATTGGGTRTYAAPLFTSTGLFFGGSSYNRGRGYYGSRSACSRCGYNPCRCSSHSGSRSSGHDHSKHPHAHNTYAIAGGGVRPTQTKPSGFHSLDWYKSRGYDTSRLKLVNEHGQPKGHSQSRSKSSGSSSSSSSGSSRSKSKSSGGSSKSSGGSSKSKSKSSGGSSKSKSKSKSSGGSSALATRR